MRAEDAIHFWCIIHSLAFHFSVELRIVLCGSHSSLSFFLVVPQDVSRLLSIKILQALPNLGFQDAPQDWNAVVFLSSLQACKLGSRFKCSSIDTSSLKVQVLRRQDFKIQDFKSQGSSLDTGKSSFKTSRYVLKT